MSELQQRIISYRRTMAMVKGMLLKGIITSKEYDEIDTMIAQKYGISSCTIFRG